MLCAFVRKCDCTNQDCRTSYSEDMIMSQVITSLFNSAHQSKVLSDMAKIKTLQKFTERLLTLESTSQATTHFKPEVPATTTGITAPICSDYQRSKGKTAKPDHQPLSNQDKKKHQSDKCRGCLSSKTNTIQTDEKSLDNVSFLSSVTNQPPL